MPGWLGEHETLLWWMGATGLLTLLLTAIAIPIVLARLPVDYLVNDKDDDASRTRMHPTLRFAVLVVKNLFGWLLILAGLAMLIAPGQGLLTIFVGLSLINFPGKRRLLRSLLRRRSIHRAVNWMRAKCGVKALKLPE